MLKLRTLIGIGLLSLAFALPAQAAFASSDAQIGHSSFPAANDESYAANEVALAA